ncbi:unnamed protein product [Toxocara canis]|uniref:E3 ubiquitin protein ligase n=1 Tax=Toxocara canis TaxID=6265 RepID=A0A183U7H8_TOXCA|nr:unnamed protein product [Toxocara canis]
MQDIEVMDEHYARAYERCVHLTNKLTQRNEEIAALKVELSETKSELEYQKRALKVLQEAGDSSESQAVEVCEYVFNLLGYGAPVSPLPVNDGYVGWQCCALTPANLAAASFLCLRNLFFSAGIPSWWKDLV